MCLPPSDFVQVSEPHLSRWNSKLAALGGVDIQHFDVDALSFTQVFPTMLFRQKLHGG
jgi:hypothetical protein